MSSRWKAKHIMSHQQSLFLARTGTREGQMVALSTVSKAVEVCDGLKNISEIADSWVLGKKIS